jgi:hypothetical protein
MADEAEVARLTGEIADAMLKARSKLQDVASALEVTNLPGTLERRLEDVQELGAYGDRIRQREAESNGAIGVDATRAADERLQTSFREAQGMSGDLATAIRKIDVGLHTEHTALRDTAKGLDERLADVDALDKLSGVEPETTTKLRDGLNGLKTATENARKGIELAGGRLETAWTAARRLESLQLRVDIHPRHSAEIGSTATTVQTQLRNARAGLEVLRADVGDVRSPTSAVEQTTEHGVRTAQAAAQAATAAADKATGNTADAVHADSAVNGAPQVDSELAHALNAGVTPGPAAGTAPATPTDPRLDYMMPAKGHESAGQRDDRDNGR